MFEDAMANRDAATTGIDEQTRREFARLRWYVRAVIVFGVVFLLLPAALKPIWYSIFGWVSVGIAWSRVRQLPAECQGQLQSHC